MVRDYVPTWCFIGREGCIRANDLQAMTRSAGMTELVCRTGVEQKCFGARHNSRRSCEAMRGIQSDLGRLTSVFCLIPYAPSRENHLPSSHQTSFSDPPTLSE